MKTKAKTTDKIEGEGSYTATHNYNEGVRKTVKAGHVEEDAKAAKKALDGPERKELEEAERIGKSKRRS